MIRKALLPSLLALLVAVMAPAVAIAGGGNELREPAGLRVLARPEDAGRQISLTWDTVEKAFGYNVYRSDTEGGPLTQVGGKAADSFLYYPVFIDYDVEPGRAYYYAVTTVDAELNESPATERVFAYLEPAARAASGAKKIVCSLTDQRLYFFAGDQLVNVTRCSTGLNNRTPAGSFRILGHYGTNVGLGGAVCDYWMSFTSAHGMHSWPRGSRSYETGLGSPASHGCIRQHPMEAYWPYYWAPDGTPLAITYASLSRRIISGCHSSAGAPGLSEEWYFAEGYTAEAYDTYLLLSNPGENGVDAMVYFYKESGEVVEQICGIAPHSRYTLTVDDVTGMDATAFSIRVKASGPIVAERAMYFSAGNRTDGTVSLGATRASADWYFAEGYTAENFDTYLLLANPGDDPVNAWVYFFLEGGGMVDYVFWVGPHSRFTMPVDAFPVVGAASFSMQAHADGPIVAERAMYFDKGYIKGGHASVGAAQTSQSWYFAEGCTRRFFESYVMVCNPGDEDAFVTMDFYLNEGSLRHEYLVAAHSRATVPISSQGGLDDTEMAFSVYADHPVVAERSVYYDLDSHRGGHAALGSPVASPGWYFAEGYTDNAFDTYLLLSNPSFQPAHVEVVFQREDGSVFGQGYLVPAQRRVTVSVDSLPGLDRASFSTTVVSDVPIMAERTMYFVMTRGY
ncbi:MAG: L,D-transpeptidase family protein [Actinobacteria bacterium]|nr:L,D-transpeptidase family protein [Actinomycetota bacterium]